MSQILSVIPLIDGKYQLHLNLERHSVKITKCVKIFAVQNEKSTSILLKKDHTVSGKKLMLILSILNGRKKLAFAIR